MRKLIGIFAAVLFLNGLVARAQTAPAHEVTLTWTASVSSAACASNCTLGYNIYRGTAPGAEAATPVNAAPVTALTYTDPVTLGSAPQTFYYYVETVETAGGVVVNSTQSSEVSATFPAVPAPPTGLSISEK